MAETPVLEAVARGGVGKGAARQSRREGYVPGVIYGGGQEPQPIGVKFNVLLKELKAGRFLSKLINVKVDGTDNVVVCRGVQRDVVKDLPVHIDFLRLTERTRIALHIPIEYVNREKSPGLKRGGVLTEVRHDLELFVTAGNIPDKVTIDLAGTEINDTIHISHVVLPAGASPVISDRDFAIANIQAPSGLRSEENEGGESAEG
ncbi:MAG: 50S ribosomal protein L25/general stress protein Ctc [Amaricoccus sp.]|uniref:50S ribosomal protein L25/general stress protein Ctc n=1 Tax=Amaricoccus sp. TaxID=1872485 RepID=UPI0039E59BA9